MAQGGSPAELIAAVNALRQVNGLPAYRVNQKLMAAAQGHSAYQASIGSVTHTGVGGSQPRDRAAAAGYGNGAAFSISENIAGGGNLSPQEAVGWWQGDSPHLTTMLSSSYTEVGAGMAVSGSTVYYTLDAGYIAGEAGSGAELNPPANPGATTPAGAPPAATVEAMLPVKVATPGPDGSVIHVVETGQFLLTIASAYKVKINELLDLNNLTDQSIIYPGDKLLIRKSERTPTSTAAETSLPTTPPLPTPTRRTTRTPTSAAPPGTALAMVNTIEITIEEEPESATPAARRVDPVLLVIGGLAFLGTILIIGGSVMLGGSR